MDHLKTEQIIKIALDQMEASFPSIAPSKENIENEKLFHLKLCANCREKMEQWIQTYQKIPTLPTISVPEKLALRTYQSLQKSLQKQSQIRRKVSPWKFSHLSRAILLSAAVVFICFGFFTPKFSEAMTVASQDACHARLKTLYCGVMSYVKTHGEYPPTNRVTFLTTLYKSNILKDPQDFLCPGYHCFGTSHPWLGPEIHENVTYPELLQKDLLSAVGYEGRYFPINPDMDSRAIPIIWDKAENHENGRNILFLDGHIEFITEEKFQKLFYSKFHDYPLYLYE
ncbi:MAG: hypothetical protein AABZ60_12490 [Planctomycetota bacterium]